MDFSPYLIYLHSSLLKVREKKEEIGILKTFWSCNSERVLQKSPQIVQCIKYFNSDINMI